MQVTAGRTCTCQILGDQNRDVLLLINQLREEFFLAGDSGSHLYVSGEGEFEVIKEGKVLGRLGVGKAFGELAILYNCKRTASIKAVTDGKIWALERSVFQQIMVSTGLKKTENQVCKDGHTVQ